MIFKITLREIWQSRTRKYQLLITPNLQWIYKHCYRHVTTFIVEEIKSSTYYNLILDSTPDISHLDQLTLIIYKWRHSRKIFRIHTNSRTHCFVFGRTALRIFKKLGIDIKLCRGQSYDNAANKSGKYYGLQTRIKSYSSNAVYIPCASHNLNLIGNFAADSGNPACHFIFMQKLFTFFSSSTHR